MKPGPTLALQPDQSLSGSSIPRVYYWNREIVEMANVSSGDGGTVARSNTGNLGIREPHRAPPVLAVDIDPRRVQRRRHVEREHPVLEIVEQQLVERGKQRPLTAALRLCVDPSSDFKNGDRGQPEFLRIDPIQPRDHLQIGVIRHQFRRNIRVYDDHGSKCTKRDRSLRASSTARLKTSSSLLVKPILLNRAEARVPNPGAGLRLARSFSAASLRISRASASRLRPLRVARALRRSLTSSSRLRTISCAMADPPL